MRKMFSTKPAMSSAFLSGKTSCSPAARIQLPKILFDQLKPRPEPMSNDYAIILP